jgi:hypothetical protein
MRRVISASAFILKGAGWYVTDYPSQDRKKGVEAEKGPEKAKADAPAEKPSAPAEKEKKAPAAKPPGEKAKKGRKD